jgi:hypothetical protein
MLIILSNLRNLGLLGALKAKPFVDLTLLPRVA